ncbi:MAG: ABC transporter ATP-binding protein [Desulfovermiculus sp.]|nr:ABC transporter ATP-binding protein [Desulfovermiculus sp.]
MITVNNLTKIFHLYKKPSDRLREIITGKTYHREFRALSDVSFAVQEGETLGIIGENGSGKSTLLKIITGVLMPDAGTFEVDGRITGLLELGTGFNPEFSGLSNIYMNATYLGLSKSEIDERRDQIISFAELGEFIQEPIKTYSSGMLMRLAFSTAIHADPKCFVVDEALAVGDAHFQQKCMQRLKQFRAGGGSIVFVSHDMNAVKILCDKAILLEDGILVERGFPEQVINTYNFLIAKKDKGEEIKFSEQIEESTAYGNEKVVINSVCICNSEEESCEVLVSGRPCFIDIQLKSMHSVDDVTVGIVVRDRFGQDIFGVNTYHLKIPIALHADEEKTVRYAFDEFNIGPGKYTVSVAAHSQDVHVHDCYQWVDRVCKFEVVQGSDFSFIGLSRLKPRVITAA